MPSVTAFSPSFVMITSIALGFLLGSILIVSSIVFSPKSTEYLSPLIVSLILVRFSAGMALPLVSKACKLQVPSSSFMSFLTASSFSPAGVGSTKPATSRPTVAAVCRSILIAWPPERGRETDSGHEHIHEICHSGCLQSWPVLTERHDRLHALGRQLRRQVGACLFEQQRQSIGAAAAVAERVLHFDSLRGAAAFEKHLHRVGDRALVGLQILPAIARIFLHHHLLAQPIDARVGGNPILVMVRRQLPEDQADAGDVLNAMVAVGRIVQRPRLADDADRRLLRRDLDALDLIEPILHLRV